MTSAVKDICWYQVAGIPCGEPAVKFLRWNDKSGRPVASSFCADHLTQGEALANPQA